MHRTPVAAFWVLSREGPTSPGLLPVEILETILTMVVTFVTAAGMLDELGTALGEDWFMLLLQDLQMDTISWQIADQIFKGGIMKTACVHS